jgi:hypothetical protein
MVISFNFISSHVISSHLSVCLPIYLALHLGRNCLHSCLKIKLYFSCHNWTFSGTHGNTLQYVLMINMTGCWFSAVGCLRKTIFVRRIGGVDRHIFQDMRDERQLHTHTPAKKHNIICNRMDFDFLDIIYAFINHINSWDMRTAPHLSKRVLVHS